VFIASGGGILGQGVALLSSSVPFTLLRLGSTAKLCCIEICNILNSEQLIYDLYVCTCVFLLYQESFDMILDNNLSFYDGGITVIGLTKQSGRCWELNNFSTRWGNFVPQSTRRPI
jgi:hypothetical protein